VISLVLYYPDTNTFTHCLCGLVYGNIDIDELKDTKVYKRLLNIANAIGKTPYYICVFNDDYRSMDNNEILARCKECYAIA